MKKYLVSGIGPVANSGTGDLMIRLNSLAKHYGYEPLFRTSKIYQGDENHKFDAAVASIKDSRVIVAHPQTLGFHLLYFLFANKNHISIYVLDNSFFCINSYNYRSSNPHGEFAECLDCLGNPDSCHSYCSPFPNEKISRELNLFHLKLLQKYGKEILFLTQNTNQEKLIKRHFGFDTATKVVGMVTDEFFRDCSSESCTGKNKYDIVFHANVLEAKGLSYVLRLAEVLNEFSFFIPIDPLWIHTRRKLRDIPKNVVFKNVQWANGLREIVQDCGLVLCPSLWSAPVEAALIKSALYNGNVGVYNTEYGFQAEFPDDSLIRLDANLEESASKIREHFKVGGLEKRDKLQVWIKEYIQKADLKSVFENGTNISEILSDGEFAKEARTMLELEYRSLLDSYNFLYSMNGLGIRYVRLKGYSKKIIPALTRRLKAVSQRIGIRHDS